ncbi:hypothetical protein F5B19DRAFT_480596 [Rostrohypoxylon terebratum]|nr:hypothetical protein F5B19DRAFT_480596 [Rostrohypoxylon terebratum]
MPTSIRPSKSHTSPHVPARTRYSQLVIEAYEFSGKYNLLAAVASWLLLAGFVIIPGTYTSLQKADLGATGAGKVLNNVIQHTSLLGIAITCCILGIAGIGVLWWWFRNSYVWLNDRIFLPGILNATTGLVTTLVNIYTAKNGAWSATAIATVTLIGVILGVMVAGFSAYALLIRGLSNKG